MTMNHLLIQILDLFIYSYLEIKSRHSNNWKCFNELYAYSNTWSLYLVCNIWHVNTSVITRSHCCLIVSDCVLSKATLIDLIDTQIIYRRQTTLLIINKVIVTRNASYNWLWISRWIISNSPEMGSSVWANINKSRDYWLHKKQEYFFVETYDE